MNGTERLIDRFNHRHDLALDGQTLQLVEEIGELAEAVQRDADEEQLREEAADVIFVAASVSLLVDGRPGDDAHYVARQNLQKDATTDGDKVTKSGLHDSTTHE